MFFKNVKKNQKKFNNNKVKLNNFMKYIFLIQIQMQYNIATSNLENLTEIQLKNQH